MIWGKKKMNKKILVMALVGIFLIAGLTTASAVVINSKITTTEMGNIVCYVFDKDAPPGPVIEGLEGIKLELKNYDGTLKWEGVTDKTGQYIFVDIPYGEYLLTANGGAKYSNETKIIQMKEPVSYVSFGLTAKSRLRNHINFILLELFEHFPILSRLINIVIKT